MQNINTMRDEVATLPNLDEFDGMSIVDIAHNIVNWPEGSEEQNRAILAIQARAPGIGHNRPPLDEQLTMDLQGYQGEVDALLEVAEKSIIVDEVSAAKVNDLVRTIADKGAAIDTARKAKTQPFRDAVDLINGRYNALLRTLTIARLGPDGNGGLRDMLTQWDNKQRAEAAAAREKAEREQREREEAAAEAQRKAEAARNQGDHAGAIAGDLRAASLADQAERAGRRADAIRPQPVRSHLGTTTRQKRIVFKIIDEKKAFEWALSTPGIKGNVLEDLSTRIGAYLRSSAIGVRGVERGVDIPGVTATTELAPVSSRR